MNKMEGNPRLILDGFDFYWKWKLFGFFELHFDWIQLQIVYPSLFAFESLSDSAVLSVSVFDVVTGEF